MRFEKLKNKGAAIILVAGILLGFLLIFFVVAFDFSRMYYVRGELQSAADSGALAGAAKITDPADTAQTIAKQEAKTFAEKNMAAKSPVSLALNFADADLTNSNDITVGHWDGTNYTLSGTPVNAVQVRARRTSDSPGGEVPLLFPKLIPGMQTMGVARLAIAARLPRTSSNIALCTDACPSTGTWPNIQVLNPPRIMETGPGTPPYDHSYAWTSLLVNPTAQGFNLSNLICTQNQSEDVCNKDIYSTMGQSTDTMRDFESLFADPSSAKTECPPFGTAANCPGVAGGGQGWWIIVPVTQACPPGAQGNAWDPKLVDRYALIRVSTVCTTGAAGCRGYDACSKYTDENGVDHNNVIVIDRISCIGCADADELSGPKAFLVK